MIKLSQCMIVKNEEANIEKALSWAKDIAYEQIVVDTGSTDRTVEIAEKMGAKVYHFEWIDDFSVAKNYAIEKATGDWIAFLDADEYFNKEDTKKLIAYLEELKDSKYVTILTSMLHLDDKGKVFRSGVQTRIFRNMENLRYRNPIHEVLVLEGESLINFSIDIRDDLSIFHTGYADGVNENKKKGERNIPLLLKEIEKNPTDRNLMSYLGDAYLSNHDYEEAEKWFEKSIDSLHTFVGKYAMRISSSFTHLMITLYHEKKFEKFLKVYEQAVHVIPEESDFDYMVSFYWIVQKRNFEKGAFHLEQAFKKLESNKESLYGELLSGEIEKALEQCMICYYNLQNWTKCIENCILLLKENLYQYTAIKILLNVFQIDETKSGKNGKVVLQFLSQLYSLQSLKDRMYLLRAATEIHYDSLILELRNLCTSEELAAIDGSIGK